MAWSSGWIINDINDIIQSDVLDLEVTEREP